MVKVGFICEGETEKAIIESGVFLNLLIKYKLQLIGPIINPEGKPNLIKNKDNFCATLYAAGAEIVFILTDKDSIECFTKAKIPFYPKETEKIIIAQQLLESWFLADSSTMRIVFAKPDFNYDNPENEIDPFSKIRNLSVELTGRRFGNDKMIFARRMIREGFSIENAANHPNCNSAKYFIKKLQELNLN